MARSQRKAGGSRSGGGASRGSTKSKSKKAAAVEVEVVEEEGGMGIDDGIAIMTTLVLIAAILLVDYWQSVFADGGKFFSGG